MLYIIISNFLSYILLCLIKNGYLYKFKHLCQFFVNDKFFNKFFEDFLLVKDTSINTNTLILVNTN